jgi:3-phenylpropionate/trans-cinnamate dioxygenase ferredoxin subunit
VADFVKVCSTNDIRSGSMKGFELQGRRFLVANVGGKFYAIDSVCTHRQCPLEEGTLDGQEVECSCHGSRFDVTSGEVKNPPARVPAKVIPLKVEGSELKAQV